MKLKRHLIGNLSDWTIARPLSVLGPTGSGKTALVTQFVRSSGLRPLLVSLDSVAAYRELNIGSSKPFGSDRDDFEWCGLDLVSVDVKMSAALMKNAVAPKVAAAQQDKVPIIFVGGTHFYERFILEGAGPGTASDEKFIAQLCAEGGKAVFERLKACDARWGDRLHPNDNYRIFRHADLVFRQGLTYDILRSGSDCPLFPEVDTLVVHSEPAELNAKLSARIDEMFARGWINEVESLLMSFPKAPGLQTVGYSEIVSYLTGTSIPNLGALKDLIAIRHRQLAKQQRTWLRKI